MTTTSSSETPVVLSQEVNKTAHPFERANLDGLLISM